MVAGFAEQVAQAGRAERAFQKPGEIVMAPKEQVLAAEAVPFVIDLLLGLGQMPRTLQASFLGPDAAPGSRHSRQLGKLALREQRARP